MNFLKLFSVALLLTFLFQSCKKDVDFTDRPSYGTLQSASGECLPKNIHGVYKSGVTFVNANYIDVHVNIDSVGSYNIVTDTINGFYFKGTGTLGVKGDNLVRLYGHGKPLSGGTTTFVISYSGTYCTVDVPVDGTVLPPAAYTLDNAAGECSGAIANGTYATGLALGAGNTVTLSVNVTTIGLYTISTNTKNGIHFSKSGNFTTTGVQTITLTGTGTPETSTKNNYTATAGSSTCTFSVEATTVAAGVFTLGGAGSTCTGAIPNGTFKAGTALTALNTLSIQTNVTTAGTYTISTDTKNGISFSGTGVFTGTGTQTVVLTGTGMPIAEGANNYTITGGSSSCIIPLTVISGGGGIPGSTDFYFKGTINSKSINFKVNTPPNIIGESADFSNADPLTGAGKYGYGFDISDFDKIDTNDIGVFIVKNFSAAPTQAEQLSMFHTGGYDYSGSAQVVHIEYMDENGIVWTSEGDQVSSTFNITELIDAPADIDALKIFTAKFNCKLYNTITAEVIKVVNGEMRGVAVSR